MLPDIASAQTARLYTFHGKVALVTGAASGIGRATASLLAASGAQVMIGDRDVARSAAVAGEIREAGGDAISLALDVADPTSVQAIVDQTVDQFGALHLAVNGAAVEGTRQTITDYEIDVWRRLIDVNLNGVFYSMKFELLAMLATGKGAGAIVNIASVLGLRGSANASAYSSAKHGVIGLTKSAAAGCAAEGIRINAVAPGYIDTPLLRSLPPEALSTAEARHPIGRLGTAKEVAEVIVFLLSERASFVTGGVYGVDGGFTAW